MSGDKRLRQTPKFELGTDLSLHVAAGEWKQIDAVLYPYSPSIQHGYVRITRTSGSNPFIAYGVLNDGSLPGQRSGDGALFYSAP